ncbi:Fic family protein [Qipengyuania aquimaris]|uniref:Fic family protein n=1 Tax=Qipengyuania aquimaris TaxID=255984 RepID=UPI001CD3E5AE|nr:Fic family protein [Qipengyuania aquimaris]MCA0903895.1 Fic family protein [Qipengyuania aquimaris]
MRAHFSRALAGPITPENLVTALCEANASLPGCSGKIRTAETGLTPNATGIQVYFPPAGTVSPQVEAIARFIAQGEDPLLAAIGALGMLLNCHPFSDGNGRVSRALYDHLLHRAGSRDFFPLYPLLFAARRSFDLALREAEIKGDWSPFVIHNCLLISITADWPRDEAASKNTALHGANQ